MGHMIDYLYFSYKIQKNSFEIWEERIRGNPEAIFEISNKFVKVALRRWIKWRQTIDVYPFELIYDTFDASWW